MGLYAAEGINVLRDNDPERMLFCVAPCEEQATKWTPELRERYLGMIGKYTHDGCYTNLQNFLLYGCTLFEPCQLLNIVKKVNSATIGYFRYLFTYFQ